MHAHIHMCEHTFRCTHTFAGKIAVIPDCEGTNPHRSCLPKGLRDSWRSLLSGQGRKCTGQFWWPILLGVSRGVMPDGCSNWIPSLCVSCGQSWSECGMAAGDSRPSPGLGGGLVMGVCWTKSGIFRTLWQVTTPRLAQKGPCPEYPVKGRDWD